ncbi:hypothetical protein AMATHDRAFT_136556 [Amanita thiersii Skay4041]|uniref:Transcription factor CBF/NF-Y/archaeal histone domain-containing protein n=1 Tax=Amanita thiersii Skay4041 TaxID=703135 RepID=A0A2A9NZA3_9AGAR|nr:hypothetical protein AMATHDRAFT_136556 [Amanita thiersii Skay4041]
MEIVAEAAGDEPPVKKRRLRKEPTTLACEPGKSLLPFSRVHKIIKADKDIPVVAKDATFLISLATEEFIRRLAQASQRVASRDNRATVQYKDLATVVRKVDEFLFLEELIPWTTADAPPKRKMKQNTNECTAAASTLLDEFVVMSKKEVVGVSTEQGDM